MTVCFMFSSLVLENQAVIQQSNQADCSHLSQHYSVFEAEMSLNQNARSKFSAWALPLLDKS